MLKLLITTGVVVVGAALAVVGISSYLVIDDLKGCTEPVIASQACGPADAIIAISGGETMARADEAIRLYKAGWAPKMVFSGAALDSSGPSNAQAMRNHALKAGVPASAILIDEYSADTMANARGSLALLAANDKRIILVTSPYHQRRASIEFGRILGSSATLINHPTQTDPDWGPTWWLTIKGWWLGATELVKSFVVGVWR